MTHEMIQISAPIRVVLLDHHALMRAGLRMLMTQEQGIELAGEAGDMDDAINLVTQQKPDIVLLELNEIDQMKIIPRLLQASGRSRLILLSGSDDTDLYVQAVRYGAMGVVSSTKPPEVLLKAIRKVHAGEAWLDRTMVANVLTQLTTDPIMTMDDSEVRSASELNPREREIVQLVGQGLNARQIAKRMSLSESTIRHYFTSIYEKIGVNGRLELLIFAYRAGLTHPSEYLG